MPQTILAVAEAWGFYSSVVDVDPSQLQRLAPTANLARQLVRKSPPDQRPRILSSLRHVAQLITTAQPLPVAVYRPQPGPKGGRPRGQWLRFTFTP